MFNIISGLTTQSAIAPKGIDIALEVNGRQWMRQEMGDRKNKAPDDYKNVIQENKNV